MRKKLVILGLVLIVVVSVILYLVTTGFYNLDYLGQGQLNSVTVRDSNCMTSICDAENWEITITSPDQLKSLESAFFSKIQDVSHLTTEDGTLIFIFHYDKKDIEFHVSINIAFTGGVIYYTDRQIVYNFNKSDMSIFKKLFTYR